MKIGNTCQTALTFKAAGIIDFEDSGQSCGCTRNNDALKEADRTGLVSKRGAESFELPVIKWGRISDSDKFLVASEAELEEFKPVWRKYGDDFDKKSAQAVLDQVDKFIKAGAKTIKYRG